MLFLSIASSCFSVAPNVLAQSTVTLIRHDRHQHQSHESRLIVDAAPRLSGAYRGSRIEACAARSFHWTRTCLLFEPEKGPRWADGSVGGRGHDLQPRGVDRHRRAAGRGVGTPVLRRSPFRSGDDLPPSARGRSPPGLNNLSKITPYTDDGIALSVARLSTASRRRSWSHCATAAMATDYPATTKRLRIATDRFAFPTRISKRMAVRPCARTSAVSPTSSAQRPPMRRSSTATAVRRGIDDSLSLSMRYAFSPRLRASLGYAYARGRSGGDNDADQFSVACEATISAKTPALREQRDAAVTARRHLHPARRQRHRPSRGLSGCAGSRRAIGNDRAVLARYWPRGRLNDPARATVFSPVAM